jgi:hypothetical protein
VDFSWVKQLADQSNQHELEKQEQERRKLENERLVALATVPFVEKLFKLLQACCEEFNKYCMYPELRVMMSRGVNKRARGAYDNASSILDENAYFSFARRNSMYGIRGTNGIIEFVDDIQVSDAASSINLRLNEMSAGVIYKLVAKVEGDPMDMSKKNVVWTLNDETMDGPMLITLCQHYFSGFIKRTDD